MSIIDLVGSIGVVIIVATYFLLQVERIDSKSFLFSVLNVIGSVMILYSLMYNWNLASVLIEAFWIIISLFGIYKHYSRKNNF